MMHIDLITAGLAFIEGFALIISPCILPILPIILSASLTGSKARPLGIVVGFVLTFSSITLFSRSVIQFLHLSPDSLRIASLIILLVLGIIMMSSYLTDKFNFATRRLTNVGSSLATVNNPQSGFWGGLLFGCLVGLIWTPCAGPILAAVIVQVVIQQTSLNSLFVVLAFALGAGLPMLLIALVGRRIISKFSFFKSHASLFRQLLGFIVVLAVLYLYFLPDLSLPKATTDVVNVNSTSLINPIEHPYPAPALEGIEAWINSAPLNWELLKGKVVLVDFWTYSCINCIRTLPYLKNWYAKYHDQGLVIIGIHSPEFQFEHKVDNVKNAVETDGIVYPVGLDNRFTTWQNFKNQYWPAHYLVNREGKVVYVHFGEGEYEVTEHNIRYLLGISGSVAATKVEEGLAVIQTPETYLGYRRMERLQSALGIKEDEAFHYTYPEKLAVNEWALQGKWMITSERIISEQPGAALKMHFAGDKVYMVMGAAGSPIPVKVLLNGAVISADSGKDVVNGEVSVSHNQLYTLVDLKKGVEGTIEIIAAKPGLELYTFTFGS